MDLVWAGVAFGKEEARYRHYAFGMKRGNVMPSYRRLASPMLVKDQLTESGLAFFHRSGNRVADDFTESINRSADGLIRNHGNKAAAQARKIAARMATDRDGFGERMWKAIADAIERKRRPQAL